MLNEKLSHINKLNIKIPFNAISNNFSVYLFQIVIWNTWNAFMACILYSLIHISINYIYTH